MNLLYLLKDTTKLTANETVITQYILHHTERILNMSIYELAYETNSSTSTIVRLCKKTNCSGFKEFKIRLSRDLENYYQNIQSIDVNLPFHRTDSDIAIAKKIAQLTKETIDITQSQLTDQLLRKSVDLIINAERLIAIGVSNSFVRLQDFQAKLLRINKFVHLIHLQPEQFYLATNATKNDVAIIVSYSGNTAEIVNEAKIFKKKKTAIIAITANLDSQLAKVATLLLALPNHENSEGKVSTFSSQLAIEYTLNVLYSCIYSRNFETNYQNQKNTPTSYLKF